MSEKPELGTCDGTDKPHYERFVCTNWQPCEPVASPQATRPLDKKDIAADIRKAYVEKYGEESWNQIAAQPAAGTTPTRNSEVLADFVKYCEAHPAQRFWQALRNWSTYPFVIVTDGEKWRADTFDWEGRRHDE